MKPRLRFSALVWALGLVASSAAAQVPTLVKTINTTGTGSSSPGGFAVVGSTTFFAANDGIHGVELWMTDGSALGTVMLKDIRPGSADSNPQNLLSVGGTTLFFTADDGVNGVELWKSDGTPGGTVMVLAANGGIRNGANKGSDPSGLVEYTPGLVLFAANDGVFGRELWRSDGTDVGTTMVANIYAASGSSNPTFLTNFGGFVYFAADSVNVSNLSIGVELWRTDGTSFGTTLVADINPAGNGRVSDLTVAGGRLFFVANDGINGVELWQYDGVSASMLKPTAGGIRFVGDSNPAHLTALGSTLFFSARDDTGGHGIELWKSNGTDLGTMLVADINPTTANSNPANLTAVGGTLFFTADDGTHGTELWKTDGLATGIVQDIVLGAASSNPQYLVNAAGTLFFSAAGPGGVELWKSTGTGATQIPDINPFGSSLPTGLTAAGSTVYFSADDGTHGTELWKSNGTTATLVADINVTRDAAIFGAVRMGENVFFSANDGTSGAELWKSDGSLAGTVLVQDINITPATGDSSFPSNLAVVSLTAGTDTLFFAATDGSHGNELWRSDGTPGGTTMVADIISGPGSSDPHGLVNVNGTLFFAATNASGTELWKSDGTPGGTVRVADISPGPTSSNPQFLTDVNGTLYFAANDGVHGNELWKSDGSAVGTVLVKDIKALGGSSNPTSLTNLNGTLLFTADEPTYGNDLWKSDGTDLGTVPIDIRTGAGSSNPSSLTVMGSALFLAASDGSTQALWKYDALGGAVSVKGLSSAAQSLTNVSGTLYFLEVKTSGTVLWRSDGTTGGTVALTTFSATVSPAAGNLTGVFGTLYFAADDGVNGLELWKSNAMGTSLVADIFTGAGPSSPAQLTTLPGGLLFTATDSIQGRQLWGIVTADVGVDQIATPNPVALDGVTNVTLTGTVTNHGHVAAPGVVLTETLSSVNFVSGSWTSGANSGSCGGSPVKCAVGTLDPGAVATVTLTVTPTLVGSFPEKAAVATTTTDLNPTNDSATTPLAVWPLISIADASVEEGNTGTQNMDFVVTLAHPSANTVTVQYATADGLAPTAATAPADYTTTTGALTFLPGVTVGHIFVPIVGDTLPEPNEQLFVNLSAPAFAFISRAQGIGTIKDNDSYQIAIGDAFINEGDTGTSNMDFTVTLTGVLTNNTILIDYTTGPGLVSLATAGTTPTPPVDYMTTTGTLTFPSNPGVSTTTRTISVPIVGDLWNEDNETFQVILSINPLSPLKAPNVILTDKFGLGTIQDTDPLPSLSINDVTVTEGNSGTTNAVFTVTLDNPSGRTVSVAYATAAGTATEGLTAVVPTDYLKRSGSLTFPSGTTSLTISVPIVGDTVHEADETFFVTLTSPTNALIAKNQGVGTIQDDDFQISIDNVPSATEGDVPGVTTDAVFTVTLAGTLRAANLQVKYATAPGTATGGATADALNADYVSQTGTLTFTPGGPLTQTIAVPVVGDTIDEDDETFFVNLTKDPLSPVPAGNVTLVAPAHGVGTITDDDPKPNLSINDVAVAEGNSGTTNATFNVTLDAASGWTVTVAWATASPAPGPGAATAGTVAASPTDYLIRSGVLTFAPTITSLPVSVPVVGDTNHEVDETFFVNLTNPTNAVIAKAQGVGTIQDDDYQVSINDMSTPEGDSGTNPLLFTVTLNGTLHTLPLLIHYTTANGTALEPGDYTLTAGTLTFPVDPNQTSSTQTISVPIVGDLVNEDDENFAVKLSVEAGSPVGSANVTFLPGQASGLAGQGRGTIQNDDPPPNMSIIDATPNPIPEGNSGTTNATFTVMLDVASARTIVVNYATTADGTATGGAVATGPTDYLAKTGALTFVPGDTIKTIVVSVVGDTHDDLDQETFFVHLTNPNPTAVTITRDTGQAVIRDDDIPQLSINNVTVVEGNTGATPTALFTVSLSTAPAQQVTVDYATADGTASGTAGPPPQDYLPKSGTLTFATGQLTQTIPVTVIGDELSEANETFVVNLTNASANANIGSAQGIGTITNDDALPTLSVGDVAVLEGTAVGNVVATFHVTLSKIAGQAVTVKYTTLNGTALQPADYTLTAGTLTFPAGSTALTVSVPIVSDGLAESNETFSLALSVPVGATLLKASGQGTILDDDAGGLLEFAAPVFTVTEGSAVATVTVKRSGSTLGTVKVNYATSDGTGIAGQDYTATRGILTFGAGVASRSFTVPIANNLANKPDNTFLCTLNNPTGGSEPLGPQSTAAVTMVDNDVTIFSFLAATYTTTEGALATKVTVRRTGTVTKGATVDYSVTGGTATLGADFVVGGTGTLTFPAGSALQTFDVLSIDDNVPELPETAVFSLGNPVSLDPTLGAKVVAPATTVVTILDNEPTIQFLTTTLNVAEPAPTATTFPVATLTVRRSTGVGTATVDYSFGGTAVAGIGGDFVPPGSGSGPSWTLEFLPGVLQQTIPLTILPDDQGEAAKTIQVTLSNAIGAGLGANTTATVTIADEQPKLQFALAAYAVAEPASIPSTVNLVVTRGTGIEPLPVTVHYAVTGGTATPPRYTLADGDLTFNTGELSKMIPVTINPDSTAEGDETVLVTLSSPVHATIGTIATTTLTITDGVTAAPAIYFSPTAYAVSEGVASVLVTVKRSGPVGGPASVNYNVAAGGTALSGLDFVGGNGSVIFLPGQSLKTFSISIVPDTIVEGPETINLVLGSPSGAVLGTQKTAVVTITDNDAGGVFSFSAPTYSVNESGGFATITVKRTGGIATDVKVHYATADGSATAGTDYTNTSGDLIFAGPTVTSLTFQIPITADTVQEGAKTVLLSLTPGTPTAGELPAVIGLGSATLSILDDDTIGAFSFSAPTFSVGEAAGAGIVTVTRTGAGSGNGGPGTPVTVHYATSAGTAANGLNYADTFGDLTFAPGETSKTFDVTVMDDGLHTPDKTVSLTLSGPTGGATLGVQPSATLWIVDGDPGPDPIAGGTIQFTVPVFTVNEGTAFATVNVQRTGPTAAPVTVHYATSNGTAFAGVGLDYTAASGTLTFTAGITARSFTVPIANNLVYKADDTFLVTLTNPTGGAVLGPQATAAVTILDNDTAVFSFLAATYTTTEGALATKVFVRRAGVVATVARVNYVVTGGTATLGSDYTAGPNGTGSGTLTFPAGSVLQSFDLVAIDDNLPEGPKTALLSLSNPASDPMPTTLAPIGARVGTPATTVVTILDNEPSVQFLATTLSVTEPALTALVYPTPTLFVRRSSGVGTATVNYTLAGTATPGGFGGGDYQYPDTPTGGTLFFLSGELQKTIPFTVWPDDLGEPVETIVVTLQSVSGASLGANTTATITINDAQPKVQFASASYTVAESTPTINLVVTRTSAAEQVIVNYSVSGTVTPGRYLPLPGTLTFDPGILSRTIPVTINQDAAAQGDETLLVTLSLAPGANATLGTPAATALTITDGVDDGPAIYFSPAAYTVSEAAPSALVTVKRSGPLTAVAEVFYTVTGGTATPGLDYLGGNGVLVFAPGQFMKTFTISLQPDKIVEAQETINLALTSPSGAVLGTQSTAAVTINDNDTTGTFSFSAPTYSISESGWAATITVKRTGVLASDVRVHYETADGVGSATAGTDYSATSGDLVFGANVASLTFQVPILDDTVQDGDKTVVLKLTPGTPTPGELPAAIGLGSATLNIVDNDVIGAFSFSAPAFSVGEKAGVATITVTRSGAASGNGGPGSPVTVHYATAAGTAVNGVNYADKSGDLTFFAGETSKTFDVTIKDDGVPTADQTVALTLSAPTGGATLGTQSTATLWILDND